ncbi:paramyosin-like [Quillaja saponaria]|uniref:Paramyosin-like n=1 Tax=Quillaja saponaria TaxID=32244 RepID=A0AAD7KSY9_QUISA|nr:paramyosin-like [Quillaja saponaria]
MQTPNAVLSDVEGDDPVPILIKNPAPEDISVEKFRELLTELDRERQAREAAENSKSELQISFNRLKALAHEAIKKRDECGRQRDEALREKEEALKSNEKVLAELEETNRVKDQVSEQRDEIAKQFDEVVKERDGLRSEIGQSTHMLVTGIEKISGKVSNFKNFTANGLPKSQKWMPHLSLGMRPREQMEQRNYEIAIEVSQLEATIGGLREEVTKKATLIENLEKTVAEKDEKIYEIEREMSEKLDTVKNEALELRQLVSEYDDKFNTSESKMESQRHLLIDQLNLVSKIHERIYDIINIVDASNSELSESLFLPQETDMEENIRASLAGMESIYELTRMVVEKTRDLVEEKNREIKNLDETEMETVTASSDNLDDLEKDENEIYNLAGALENVVKASQLEIIELQHTVDELRAELSLHKQHVEAQAKELNHRMLKIEELEEKERVANESVEGLMMDIAAAEEEITRWKVAAEQEAAAGRAVEQEFVAQLSALKQELEELKQSILESEKKLKFKEETAAAAMAARDAAEKSLKLADLRASRLRDRVEELTHQLEEFENREDLRSRYGPRYACWPWEWLGLDFVGSRRSEMQQQTSNEMELSEPLL